MSEILRFGDARSTAEACGQKIFDLLSAAKAERGRGRLAVSGGSSPKIMFEWMARQSFDWSGIEIFWVDERCVPPDNDQSNYRMTRLALLDTLALSAEQVHRIEGEIAPEEAAEKYVAAITASFGLTAGELPVFDVIHRGMGPDAHTASLFPGEPLIENSQDIAASVWVEKFAQHRVTLLPGVLARTRHTVCLITGADKAEALHRVLNGPKALLQYPAQIASPEMTWFVEEAAAALLA